MPIRVFLSLLLMLAGSSRASAQQRIPTELIIVGTIHAPTRQFNADSVALILQRVQPDLILVELDSTFFTPTMELKSAPRENEGLGIARYRQQHPQVIMRPFDFEGRNEFHRRNGILTKPGEVFALLDNLYKHHRLTPEQGATLDRYYSLTDSTRNLNRYTPYALNQPAVTRLTARRQQLQYQQIKTVVQARPELTAYHAFYQLNVDFWDTRNRAMAAHILTYIRQRQARRIVVLTGNFHKYYLLRELAPWQAAEHFRLREYYE